MGFPWGGGVLNAEWVEQYSCGCGDWIYLVLFVFSVVEWKAVCILDFLRVFFFFFGSGVVRKYWNLKSRNHLVGP